MDAGLEGTNLIAEVQRYLAAVEFFRAQGCALVWFAESPPEAAQREGAWFDRTRMEV